MPNSEWEPEKTNRQVEDCLKNLKANSWTAKTLPTILHPPLTPHHYKHDATGTPRQQQIYHCPVRQKPWLHHPQTRIIYTTSFVGPSSQWPDLQETNGTTSNSRKNVNSNISLRNTLASTSPQQKMIKTQTQLQSSRAAFINETKHTLHNSVWQSRYTNTHGNSIQLSLR